MLQDNPATRQQGTDFFPFLYTLFIIYGSLVPLDYRPIPFEDALLSFQQIRYLDLGAASRADWISNIVLYVPLTFSLAAVLANKVTNPVLSFFGSILILAFSLSLAVTIEFYQQYFPPRTVSQNDLIAETMGSVIGLLLWFGYGKRLQKLTTHILQGGRDALIASAILYVLGYLAISLFPFDFVTSLQELQNKLSDGSDAFFISSSCGGFILCSTKLVSEIFITLPIGIFLAVLLKWHTHRRAVIILIGFILGALLEIVQLFLISGVAQGISVFTRITGLLLGELVYVKMSAVKKLLPNIDYRKYLIIAFIPYVFLLALLNGWTLADQSLTSSLSEKFDNIYWLPFYYHYYTTEAAALSSLLNVVAMYLPVGLGVWLWDYNKKDSTHKITAGFIAVMLSTVMETGKIFLVDKHPDPTNLIISFASAYITYTCADLIYRWFHQPVINEPSQAIEAQRRHATSQQSTPSSLPVSQASHPFGKAIALSIFTILLWKISNYPGSSLALLGMLSLYGILLRNYAQAWLVVIPAILPIFDLSPWTGRLYFSEFDYFIVLTFAINIGYGRWNSPFKVLKPGALFLLAMYTFLYFISLLKGLFPLAAIDANAFANYYSPYNSLRVAKGFIWASLLLPLLAYHQLNQQDIKKYFTYGILAGLTATVLFSIWERAIFTGLFDFSADYRISSTFYSMHTGGAPLDAFLLLSMPFICLLLIRAKNGLLRTLVIPLLFCASLYTLLVTYSRGTYIAWVFASMMLMAGLYLCYKNQIVSQWKKTLWIPLFLILTAIVALPVLQGSFIQYRFNQAYQEVDTRSNHWRDTMNMINPDLLTSLFGMGLGSFPRTYLWNNLADRAPASFLLRQEENGHFLQLSSGRPLYIEQVIDVSAYTDYKLNLDYRMGASNSRLNISICEKAIQHSFNCQGVELVPPAILSRWQHFEHLFNTQNLGETFRPIKLIFHYSQPDSSIDIKNITLSAVDNENLIINGDFSKGMDHWFFTADDHVPWRAENLWVQILFDQGWLGLIAFILLLLYTLVQLFQQILKQDYYAAITLSSLTGFLVLGIIDSPFEQPVIALLFFMIIYLALIATQQKKVTPVNRRYKSRASKRQKYSSQ